MSDHSTICNNHHRNSAVVDTAAGKAQVVDIAGLEDILVLGDIGQVDRAVQVDKVAHRVVHILLVVDKVQVVLVAEDKVPEVDNYCPDKAAVGKVVVDTEEHLVVVHMVGKPFYAFMFLE